MDKKEFEEFVRKNPQEAMRLIAKAFKSRELLKLGNRSYVNAFKYPDSRFDVQDLDCPDGLHYYDGGLRDFREPFGSLERSAFITPPEQLVFKYGGVPYRKSGLPESAGQIASGENNSTVINDALNTLTAERTWKEKVLLKGNFTINDVIKVPSYTALEIQGKLTLADGVNDNMIENSDLTNGNEQIEIRGGILDGNKVHQTSGHGIYFKGVTDVLVKNVAVKNVKQYGIYLMHDPQCLAFEIAGCTIESADSAGIVLWYARHGLVLGNIIKSCPEGIRTDDAAGYSVINHNFIIGSSYACNFVGLLETDVVGNEIRDSTRGVYLQSSSKANLLAGNHFDGIAREAYFIDSTSERNVISGVYIQGGSPADTFDAIIVNGNLNMIANVVIRATEGAEWQYVNGVTVGGTNNVILGVVVYHGAADGIHVTGNDTVVSSCQLYNCGGDGIEIVDAFRTIVSSNRITGCGGYGVNETGTSDYTLLDGNILTNNVAGSHTVDAVNSVIGDNIT